MNHAQEQQNIIAVRRDRLGRPVEFKTDQGQIFNYEMAKEAIDLKIIENASCYLAQDGLRKIMLKSTNSDANLTDLPEF